MKTKANKNVSDKSGGWLIFPVGGKEFGLRQKGMKSQTVLSSFPIKEKRKDSFRLNHGRESGESYRKAGWWWWEFPTESQDSHKSPVSPLHFRPFIEGHFHTPADLTKKLA